MPRSTSRATSHTARRAANPSTPGRIASPQRTRCAPTEAHVHLHWRVAAPVRSTQLSTASLILNAHDLMSVAYEPSSLQAHDYAARLWHDFTNFHQLPALPTVHSLVLFISYLNATLDVAPLMVSNYLSNLSTWFLSRGFPDLQPLCDAPAVKLAMRGLAKCKPHALHQVPPITLDEVSSILADQDPSYDLCMFHAMVAIAFFGVHRLRELLVERPITQSGLSKTIQVDSVHIAHDSVSLSGPLFQHRDSRCLAWHWFHSCLRAATGWPTLTGHSLCAGAATFLSQQDIAPDVIQRLGRWRSDAFRQYLRDDPSTAWLHTRAPSLSTPTA
ncbi:hypothetical protein, variant [Allomyces macrogynus ATCC 38327]|uniref:Tyr recombinase domain-containing protein n=1 Tax=Allomyces macrogynus (strain ATCC 38327) TaxID=578462 RepID=A0A0L0RVG1_ALLM3|nr:hypothetical protein, variant [Allomyces macrogynus ATCC 38327]|eukprot:KNE54056.1 hypothetical protein, variant [Allomyces macrogynus ATCC 38327]